MPATSSTAPLASGTTTSASTRGATAATPGTRLASGNTVSSSRAPRPVISRPALPAMASTVRANAPSVLMLVTRTAMNTATPRVMPTRGNSARSRCCDRSGRLTQRHNVSTLCSLLLALLLPQRTKWRGYDLAIGDVALEDADIARELIHAGHERL